MKSNESQINNIVKRYIKLTKQVLPMMASDKKLQWPVKYDHCFQRVLSLITFVMGVGMIILNVLPTSILVIVKL